VTTQGQTIEIQPTDAQVVYVPAYDPWLVYGAPLVAYPDWVAVPGIYYDGPDLYFGVGFGIGLFAGFAWGWHAWGFDWHDRRVVYHHAAYISHSRTFANRHDFDRGPEHFDHGTARAPAFHDAAGPQNHVGGHSSAFSGFDHGGTVRGFASRGRTSLGGGFHTGGFHAAGGFHGGGFHGGGGGHR